MADVFDKAKRSEVMSRIRGKGNLDTELALLILFREHRITGWRRHQEILGRPDFVFRAARVAVFVDGCFWHGCPKHCQFPDTNRTLRRSGWKVVRIWECQLAKVPEQCIDRIQKVVNGK